jgi:hypothetical protein
MYLLQHSEIGYNILIFIVKTLRLRKFKSSCPRLKNKGLSLVLFHYEVMFLFYLYFNNWCGSQKNVLITLRDLIYLPHGLFAGLPEFIPMFTQVSSKELFWESWTLSETGRNFPQPKQTKMENAESSCPNPMFSSQTQVIFQI